MKRTLLGGVVVFSVILLLALVAALAAGCGGSTPADQTTVDDLTPSDEVISMLEDRIAAWNRGDGEAAAAFYAVNGTLFEADNGLVTQGRSRIAARLQELIDDGFTLEAVGTPIQWGCIVVEPGNAILDGQSGPLMMVFDLGPRGDQIYHQWVMPGSWD